MQMSALLPPALSMNDDDLKVSIDDKEFPKPFRELFIWAVLLDRGEMARFLWERGDSPVLTALLATKLYDSLSRLTVLSNSQLAEQYTRHKR